MQTSDGWHWFEAVENDEAQDSEQSRPVAIAFARCFASPDGQSVLTHLRRLTLERALGPGASDAMLRHLEGQRHLFSYMLALVAKGSTEQ